MDDGAILLRNILETPACDTARLVYADWLTENDDENRAEFIRERVASPRTESFLGGHDSMGWFPGTHEVGDKATFVLSRGFVSDISLPCAAFLTHAKAVFRAHPVTAVRLTDRVPLRFERRWLWHNTDHPFCRGSGGLENPDHLPGWLFAALDGHLPRAGRAANAIKAYGSEKRACEALARAMPAAVAWGREGAGLSPLPAAPGVPATV